MTFGEVAATMLPSPSEVAIGEEERLRLGAAIDELEPADREIIFLRKGLEMPYDEVAALLGKSKDACRARLHKALARLAIRYRGPLKLPRGD